MVMAVIVRNDENANTQPLLVFISWLALARFLYDFILANSSMQYAGSTTVPTPKSVIAKQRIRIYEGVRIDGVFTKVKKIKKFNTQAAMELQALITIIEMANSLVNPSPRLLVGGTVELFIMENRLN